MKNTSPGKIIMQVISLAMTILFLFWSYYQLNDQDALQWVLVYALAAILSGVFVLGYLTNVPPLILGVGCAIWAGYLAMQITYEPPLIAIEEWREMIGLLVVAVWMVPLTWASGRFRSIRSPLASSV